MTHPPRTAPSKIIAAHLRYRSRAAEGGRNGYPLLQRHEASS